MLLLPIKIHVTAVRWMMLDLITVGLYSGQHSYKLLEENLIPVGISNDTPISCRENDLYSFSKLAERIADCVCSAKAEDSSFSIGISGSWGSGKTSLINLIESELSDRRARDSNVPEVIRFNPWRFSSQEQLLTGFFNVLGSKLMGNYPKLENGVRRNIGEVLSAYSASIAYPSLASLSALFFCSGFPSGMTLSLASRIGIKFATHILGRHLQDYSKSLEDQKRDIDKELRKINPNLVVVIDDIDRLSDDEICLVFKLIALTASFPHVVYLLAYDRSVVECALNKIQKGDGAGYLEKIIQLPIEMPKLLEVDVAPQLASIIRELQSLSPFTNSMDRDDKRHSGAVLSQVVLPLIRVPRDICRLKNSALTSQTRTDGEICPADILGMSAIQCLAPDLSAWLWENSDYLFNAKKEMRNDAQRAKLNQVFQNSARKSCRGCSIDFDSISRHILELDFPEKCSRRSLEVEEAARIRGRVSCFSLFKLFYSSKLESGLSKTEFDLICNSSNSDVLLRAFNNAHSNEEKIELAGRLIIGIEGIDQARCLQLVEEVLTLMSAEDEDLTPRLVISPMESYTRLFEALGVHIGKIQFGNWLINKIKYEEEDCYAGLVYFIKDERLHRKEASLDKITLTEECFLELCKQYSSWMSRSFMALLQRAAIFEFKIWQVIDDDCDFSNWNQFELELTKNEEAAILFGTQQMSIERSWNTGEVMFGTIQGGDVNVTHEMISSVWLKPWYLSLKLPAKKFIAAHYMKTDPDQNANDTVVDSRVSALVKEWDEMAIQVRINDET